MTNIPPKDTLESNSEGNSEERDRNNPDKDGPSANFAALIEAIKAEGAANRREEQREDRGKKWREIITIALIACTLGAVCWQVYEMVKVYEPVREQAEASKTAAAAATKQSENSDKTLIASNRAWVGPVDAKIEGPIEIGKSTKIVVTVQNSGREPAKSFSWEIVPLTGPVSALMLTQDIENYVNTCFATKIRKRAQVLFPAVGLGAGFNFTADISGDKVDAGVIAGTTLLIARGCIIYETSDQIRHSSFCYFYKAGTNKPDHLGICPSGSEAD